jgi:DNA repair protein RecO
VEQIRDLAIVLKSVRFEERHRIVTALTENHGKITVMARNSIQSRRFGGALEVFTAGDWCFVPKPGTDLWRIDEAAARRSFEGIRSDFEKMALAGAFCETLVKLAPAHEPCTNLFKLLSNSLAAAEESSSTLPLLNAFFAKCLQWAGVQPIIHQCLECRTALGAVDGFETDPVIGCLISEAGWICPPCRSTTTRHLQAGNHNLVDLRISGLLDLYTGLRTPIRSVGANSHAAETTHRALAQFLFGLLAYHVPGFDRSEIKSLKFLAVDAAN